jgi:ribA/ribD-fused uncharacterized protein
MSDKAVLYDSDLYGGKVDLTNNRIYFCGGIFSQWAKCEFKCFDLDETLNCSEQGMMLWKARMFEDQESYVKILKSKDPREQKAFGRKVKNFNPDEWSGVARSLVTELNYQKFSQHPQWRELLILTGDSEIVEASAYDKIWGIGLAPDDPNVTDKSKWQGDNLLGKAIMDARTRIVGGLYE